MFRSSKIKNFCKLLFSVCIIVIRYVFFIDLFAVEWYIKVPVIFFSDISAGSALIGLLLLFAGFSDAGNMAGINKNSTAEKYRTMAQKCVSVYKGCNWTALFCSFAYLLILSIITSFDMFYLHIIAFIILFFKLRCRVFIFCEERLRRRAIVLIKYYSSQSHERKDEYQQILNENNRVAKYYSDMLIGADTSIPMVGNLCFTPEYIGEFSFPDYAGLSNALAGTYNDFCSHYTNFIETSENKNRAEESIHKSTCTALLSLRTMLNQEYNIINVSKSKGINDENFNKVLDLTRNIRNDVVQIMCKERDSLIQKFDGNLDEEMEDHIKSHNVFFQNTGKCILPIEIYYQKKAKIKADLVDMFYSKER